MTSPERTTICLVGDHPFKVGAIVTRDGHPQQWEVIYADPQRISLETVK